MSRSARVTALILGTVLILGILAAPAAAQDCGCPVDCLSPGFWKNHPDAWPVSSITIGGESYTKSQAIALMSMPTAGDKSYTLFRALVAAKLNVLNGCEPCCRTEGAILDADGWFAAHGVGTGVPASGQAWQNGGECMYWILDAFNNS